MPRLGTKELLNAQIPLPPLAEQRCIAAKLDRLCDIIAKRKAQLSQLQQLVKSRFVEMFGDPMTNPKGWPTARLGEMCEFMTSGSRGWAKYYSADGEMFITIKNVKGGKIDLTNVQRIQPPAGAETERTRVKEGDLLISITADLGRTGVVAKEIADAGAYINQHLSIIRLNRRKIDPMFAAFYIEGVEGKRQIERLNQSAVKAGLSFASLKSLQLPLPPLGEQRKFAAFVEKVDKLAAAAKRGLAAAERLYRQQLQEVFNEARPRKAGV